VRKVTEGEAAQGVPATRKIERIYLGGFEVYREYNGNGQNVTLERETLHIMDDKQRIALVETQTKGTGAQNQLTRYQLNNHLGSACLELNPDAKIISYEEYYPYGSTSYQAVDPNITSTAKRYRYTGKERDEETGLCYHGARYYAPWLARWTSADLAGMVDGVNLYQYTRSNPIRFIDPHGMASNPADELRAKVKSQIGEAKSAAQSASETAAQLTQVRNKATAVRAEAESAEYWSAKLARKDPIESERLNALYYEKTTELRQLTSQEALLVREAERANVKAAKTLKAVEKVSGELEAHPNFESGGVRTPYEGPSKLELVHDLKAAEVELQSASQNIKAALNPPKLAAAGGSEHGGGAPPVESPSGGTPKSSAVPERAPGRFSFKSIFRGITPKGILGGLASALFWVSNIISFMKAKTPEEKAHVAVETALWWTLAETIGARALGVLSLMTLQSDNPVVVEEQEAEKRRLIEAGEWKCEYWICGPVKK
jgi:RHS repeat-associated protein